MPVNINKLQITANTILDGSPTESDLTKLSAYELVKKRSKRYRSESNQNDFPDAANNKGSWVYSTGENLWRYSDGNNWVLLQNTQPSA